MLRSRSTLARTEAAAIEQDAGIAVSQAGLRLGELGQQEIVDEQVRRSGGQGLDRPAHGQPRGGQNTQAVDLLRAGLADGARQ